MTAHDALDDAPIILATEPPVALNTLLADFVPPILLTRNILVPDAQLTTVPVVFGAEIVTVIVPPVYPDPLAVTVIAEMALALTVAVAAAPVPPPE